MDRVKEKFLVITINHSNAGFFAYVNFAINQLIFAREHGLRAVVNFGPTSGDGPNAFWDSRQGNNIWDYYFEPVDEFTYNQIEARIADPADPLTKDDLITLDTKQLWKIHNHEQKSVYPYPHGSEIKRFERDADWYSAQREKGRLMVQEYIRVKPHILDVVNSFYQEEFAGHKVLGVHLRGTDKGTASLPPQLMRIIKPKEYFPHIDAYSRRYGPSKIFVATDQKQFLDQMVARYGSRVLSYDAIRASGFLNPFHVNGNGYRKGLDVLVDCLLLSKSDHLLKCTSAVGEFAMYFNTTLECKDMNDPTKHLSKLQRVAIELRHRAWMRYLGYY